MLKGIRLLGALLLRHAPGSTFISDKLYLKMLYALTMGKKLNLKNPQLFTEKIQWLKLYNRKPKYTHMVDKYNVKTYVAEKIGNTYIIPTLGSWEKFEDIDFDNLPNKFVLKTTHGGGSCGVVICTDKTKFNKNLAKKKLERSLSQNIYHVFREWPYKNVPKRIIAEEFLEIPNKTDLTDYKIFCFNGQPKYIQVIQDRNTCETIDFFDCHWTHQDFVGLNPNCKNASVIPSKPKRLDDMLNIAKVLSTETKFIRVDLYYIKNRIYFGELTFYPASGFGKFTPAEWDYKLGNLLNLN